MDLEGIRHEREKSLGEAKTAGGKASEEARTEG
jgi:hypothetical protein